jgi:hypothetical protein
MYRRIGRGTEVKIISIYIMYLHVAVLTNAVQAKQRLIFL